MKSIGAKLLQMAAQNSGSVHTVTDPKQAQLLTDPKSKRYFHPFLAVERSATEAAEELGCNLNTMLYRIKTFVQAGLLEVARKQKRKGRAVKFYRSVHDAYFVPFVNTPYATLEERLEDQGAPIFADLLHSYAAVLRQGDLYGNYLYRAGGNVVTTDAVPERLPSGWSVTYSDTMVRLSKAEAAALADGLRKLFQSAVSKEADDAAAQDYFLMVAAMPLAKSGV